ncbi:MAG: hypothetical protein E4H41_10110 [Gemmatimonadales bacterium]|jgi:hypothetical protein|nr:MAG: hypothetical protein E4H41_10110 [Gemmatimonadales bacterium]
MSSNIRRPLAVSFFGSAFVLIALSSTSTPAAAQVSGVVVINSGPVQGRIAVGEPVFAPRPVIIYQPVRGRRVEVARYAPQVVFVERSRGRHGKSAQWYQRHGYRPVTLFYSQGRYFTQVYAARGYRGGPRFVAVTAWERHGRFYLASGGGRDRYGFTSSYTNSSHGYVYQDVRPNGDGRDWDD